MPKADSSFNMLIVAAVAVALTGFWLSICGT